VRPCSHGGATRRPHGTPHRALVGLVLGAVLAPVAFVGGSVGTSGLVLPNLVADPPEDVTLERLVDAGAEHLLVRFDGFIHNRGPGPLEVRGEDRRGDTMRARQWVAKRAGGLQPVSPPSGTPLSLVYERTDGHTHWHLKNAARYSLWNAARTKVVATAGKVGFCLEDNELAPGSGRIEPRYTNAANNFCHQGRADVPRITEGISPGWRDVYARNLPFQWVDASTIAPGTYWLGAEVDPARSLLDADPRNPVAFAPDPVVIDGYRATDMRSTDLVTDAPSPVFLDAHVEGVPGPRAFRIVSPPTHGHLDVPVGTPFAEPVITFSPDEKFRGVDSFTYAAVDTTSPFPTHPLTATVVLEVGSAPAFLIAPPVAPAPKRVRAAALSIPLVRRTSRGVQARVTAGRPGVVTVQASLAGKAVKTCTLRTAAGRSLTCAVPLRRGTDPRAIAITLRLRYGGRVVAERTVGPVGGVRG
jgi:hypothetical protein